MTAQTCVGFIKLMHVFLCTIGNMLLHFFVILHNDLLHNKIIIILCKMTTEIGLNFIVMDF